MVNSYLHKLIKSLDENHIIWLNIYPYFTSSKTLKADSYIDYVEQFIEKVRPEFVSFDSYGLSKWALHPQYFLNLEIIARESKKYNLPFWAYILTSQFGNYAKPTKGTLSFQAFCNLAYGAQGLSYFSYRQIVNSKLNITVSPVDTNYQKMPIYDAVKDLNAEIRYYSKYFCNNTIVDVSHLGETAPDGCNLVDKLPNGIKIIDYDKKGFVVSHFKKGKKEYLLFVNKDYENNQTLTILSTKRVKRLSYYSKERMRSSGEMTFDVQPGSIVLLRL